MESKRVRGSGVRHTLPYIGRFAGLWVLVTLAAVLVAAISSWLVFAQRSEDQATVSAALLLQTVLVTIAVVALGVFTTHRLAGPWIAIRRALEKVREGDLTAELRIRSHDAHLRDVETAFNSMVAALRERVGERRSA